jgi:uncharacterized lipoprotein
MKRNNIFQGISLFVVLGFLTGCAFTPQSVELAPTVSVSADEDIGQGKEVSIEVMDEREKLILGRRGTGHGGAAEITTDQNVALVVRDELVKGLQGYNFVPIQPDKDFPTSMKVEVRLLEYTTSVGFWSGGVHTRATLKVICKNQAKEYRKIYRAEGEERILFVPTAEKNAELINQILSKVLLKVLTDNQLLQFLAF